ncbi:MAG: SpoIIE family protein phosphatase [Candidatus Korobacteraceae bacterium]|jgi:sigma-B regulation protein RsbU (phosphoserine phosphatase)
MAMQLPTSVDVRAFLRRVLRPRSKLGKTTLWFGYLAIALEILNAIIRPAPGGILSGWASFISLLFVLFALLMGLRWVRRKLLWRLRNRLIVTYVFIGVIPLILLVAMALVAAYLFAGQFATYAAMSDLQSELEHMEATNRSLATQFRNLARDGKLNQQLAGEIASASDENFRHRSVSIWEGGKGFVLADPAQATMAPIKASASLAGDFAGFVLEDNRLHLRVVRRVDEGQHHLTVISDLPITAELLRHATSELGAITLFPPDKDRTTMTTKAGGPNPMSITISNNALSGAKRLQAGSVPPPSNSLDVQFPFATRLGVTDWESGKSYNGLLVVDTRPSRIYATLFSTLGENAGIFRDLLIVIAVVFGVIELIALFIGVRLTRSMTKSVAELYTATEHVNRGELQHRIQLRTSDQMAALEQSFNSMTQSLANLIAEQKEKQRMEGELAIAHEVQDLLYPDDLSGLLGLEVHGVCRPARTVSGDYYDFIPLSEDRLVLAVGDISGKGISAALLMATVHAFVRAYSLEPERTLASVALSAGVSESTLLTASGGNGNCHGELSPALLMSTLNYQLFRSTPAAKYATMFLGCYDAASRVLTYSNAGHLPPLVLSGAGNVRRLETSGTVVGLFDDVTYDESAVAMQPGDIFVAYSDGITEPENEFGEFGEERLIELILQHRDQPLARISDVVTTAVADWIAGGEQPDDVTLVLARAR